MAYKYDIGLSEEEALQLPSVDKSSTGLEGFEAQDRINSKKRPEIPYASLEEMARLSDQKEREVFEKDLSVNTEWLNASKIMYHQQNGEQWSGDDEALSKWGLTATADMLYSTTTAIGTAFNVDDLDTDQKLATYYMLDTYDKKDITGDGFKRFAQSVLTDPTTYLGGALFAKAFGSGAVKRNMMSSLRQKLATPLGVATAEGATYGLVDDIADQSIRIQSDISGKTEYDPMQTVTSTAIGTVLPKGLQVAGKGVVKGTKELGAGAMKMAQEKLDTPMGDMLTGKMNMQESGKVPTNTAKDISVENVKARVLENNDFINLSKIETDKDFRKKGKAKEYMKNLIDYAEESGKKISLSPSSDFGSSKIKLEKFYKSLGFVPNKGKMKDYETTESMIYVPKKEN